MKYKAFKKKNTRSMWIHGVTETHNNCLELIKPQNAHKKVAPYLDMCGRAFFFIFIEDHISDSGWCILCLHCTGEYCIMMSNMIVQRLLTFFTMMTPSCVILSVRILKNSFPSPSTMLYSISAFTPSSPSFAFIRPTVAPISVDSRVLRW